MSEDDRKSTNMRDYRRRSDRKYLVLVVITLVVVGGLLIALIFGVESLLTALPCLLAGAGLILIPWLVLEGLQRWRDRE